MIESVPVTSRLLPGILSDNGNALFNVMTSFEAAFHVNSIEQRWRWCQEADDGLRQPQ